jgi:hypothetical protein
VSTGLPISIVEAAIAFVEVSIVGVPKKAKPKDGPEKGATIAGYTAARWNLDKSC